MRLKRILFYLPVPALVLFVSMFNVHCSNKVKEADSKEIALSRKWYASITDSASYVGMETCKSCHTGIHASFVHTGMGLSFDKASRGKSAADFSIGAMVYDQYLNLNYHPFWKNDELFFKEYRMLGRDTIYQRAEKISYIVGSGQHTNSHIWESNGYLYQAPMTFYTQDRKWDLPPGFENGDNTRFNRKIGLECMSCHNAFPGFVAGSENKYNLVRNGIDCERCHGPGSIHVKEKSMGILIDTSVAIDYSIVNPSKLPIDLQLDVCQRCHIQGNAVLNEGKSFFDFMPGMKLSDVMHVFMPVYEGRGDEHIMASHAERMKQSRCYSESIKRVKNANTLKPYKDALTCITCHNPHVSVKTLGKEHFNSACRNCHADTKDAVCSAPVQDQKKAGMNCSGCHMPLNKTTDIPHVRVHDHRIARPSAKSAKTDHQRILKTINCIHEKQAPDLVIAEAFINYVEKFGMDIILLDSATFYLNKEKNKLKTIDHLIHILFLKKDFTGIHTFIKQTKGVREYINRTSYDNRDAWTSYRIGEACNAVQDVSAALEWYAHAVKLAPFIAEFNNKWGSTLASSGRMAEAYKVYSDLVKEHPEYAPAWSNLGYLYLVRDRNTQKAEEFLNKALALDPDYEMAWLNKAAVYMTLGQLNNALKALEKVLSINPSNIQAREGIKRIKSAG